MPYHTHPEYPWLEDDYVFGPFYRPMMYWYDRTDKKLYIGPENEPQFAITSWDQGFDFFVYDEHLAKLRPSEVCDPPLDIPLLRYDKNPDIREFLDEIPLSVRESMLPIHFRCAVGLKIIRKRTEAIDLARSIPALFLLLANMVRCGKLTFDEAAALTLKRRREIAGACGCEPSEGTVRVLSKIHAVSWQEDSIQIGAVAADPPVMRELAFLPSITVPLISALAEWPGFAHCAFFRKDRKFLKTICEDYSKLHFMDLLATRNDVLRMAQYLGINDIEKRIARLDLAASINKLHDSLVEKLNYCLRDEMELKRLVKKFGSEFFPLPVLPGNGSIVPIQTADELFNEGQIMNNCVASYADQLAQGGYTMYRVFEPERCTMLISQSISGKTEIEEIKTYCNTDPSEETIKAIREWIYLCETSEKQRVLSEHIAIENEHAPVNSPAGNILVQQEW